MRIEQTAMTGKAPHTASWVAITLLCAGMVIAAINLRGEWQVRQSERALDRQMLAISRGDRLDLLPLRSIDPDMPVRAQVHEALHLARSAAYADAPTARKRMLDEASRAIARATAARPRWGEAWTVSAYIHAMRDGPTDPRTQSALVRSYAGAPYIRHAAQWRVPFALSTWALLTPDVRTRVINEGLWLARMAPRSRTAIFAAFRQSPAYQPFLLRWRENRLADGDLQQRLSWQRERARARAAP